MTRVGIQIDEGEVMWKYQNNTVIIGYPKPDKILELEKKKKAEIQNLGTG